MMYGNRSRIWLKNEHVPNSWGRVEPASKLQEVSHYFYQKMQYFGSFKPGSRTKDKKHFEEHTSGVKYPGK